MSNNGKPAGKEIYSHFQLQTALGIRGLQESLHLWEHTGIYSNIHTYGHFKNSAHIFGLWKESGRPLIRKPDKLK